MSNSDSVGYCPNCGQRDECLTSSQGNWRVCHQHRARWFVSFDPLPASRDAMLINDALLNSYDEVSPVNCTGDWF